MVFAELTEQQRLSLLMLAYCYARMGWFAHAKKVYAALTALSARDWQAEAGLAVTLLREAKSGAAASAALDHVRRAQSYAPAAAKPCALRLLEARALWLLGRREEARAALETYKLQRNER